MPTTLPNGVTVWNVTPHDLSFWCEREEETVVAPSDGVLNALPISEYVKKRKEYNIVRVIFTPLEAGLQMIEEIKRDNPRALIVGSIIAAQAYPEDVVATIPYKPSRVYKQQRLVKSNRFTCFLKEK
jgi:hypothetical protein